MTAIASHCAGAEVAHESCRFGEQPRLVLDTGHPVMPRVEIWQCSVCGHGITLPPMADVSPLYANRASEDYLSRDAGLVRLLKTLVFRRLARRLLRYVPGTPKSIADFGTGNGMLASAFANAEPDNRVYALDFFDEPPGPLKGVKYRSFSNSTDLRDKIDLLACFHVLEHSDDPDEMLRNLRSYLRSGGTIVIEVPNVDCVWTPWFGKSCANWYAPYHRVHFSRRSLRGLIERQGLTILSEEDICGPTFALSLASWLGIKPNSLLFFLALILRPAQWLAERLSKRPSALRIIARDCRLSAA